MLIRKECSVDGCTNLSELRETLRGKKRYRSLCETHRRPGRHRRKLFNRSFCELCKSTEKIERHRLNGVGSEYCVENVICLCQKCHNKVHVEKISIIRYSRS